MPGLQGATALVAGDWDGDSHLDIAAANFGANSVAILRNNGAGSFAAAQTLSGQQGARGLAAGDWDGDGSLDLTTANSGSNSLRVLRNQP
ncbi:MAG: VCBS repeat-containing protein [Desulfobacterales bacterium]|nr:VCBS repeat-containing protein [Desulfobacterales bacterium]